MLRLDCKQLLLASTIDKLILNVRRRVVQALVPLQSAFTLASVLLENGERVEIRPLANLIVVFLLVFNLVARVPQISHRAAHEVRSTFLVLLLISRVILLLLLSVNLTIIVRIISLNLSGFDSRAKVLLLKLLATEGILRIVVVYQIFERMHANLQRFGSFKVFALNRLLLPLFKHIQIAADQLELVTDLFEFDGGVEIFRLNCLLFLAKQNLQFLAQLGVELALIYALNAQVSRLQRRVIVTQRRYLILVMVLVVLLS